MGRGNTPLALLPGVCSSVLGKLMRAAMVPLALVILVGVAVGETPNSDSATAKNIKTQPPSWMLGVWTREWIRQGKVKSSTLDVHYLQTPSYFADIRVPKDRPRFAGAASFSDLTDADLLILAKQNGFIGSTTMADTVATWHHDIQFQPPDGTEDRGRIQRLGRGRMHEHGLDGSYTEAWRQLADGGQRYLVIRTMRSGRLSQSLVVVGDQFVYARNREKDLPVAASLDTLISSTHPTRATIVEFLNFELSVGRVRGDSVSWKIERSTLPWREGRHLEFADTIATSARSGLVPRNAGDEQWTTPLNTFSLRELEALFGRQ
jgi:hypothetical protein